LGGAAERGRLANDDGGGREYSEAPPDTDEALLLLESAWDISGGLDEPVGSPQAPLDVSFQFPQPFRAGDSMMLGKPHEEGPSGRERLLDVSFQSPQPFRTGDSLVLGRPRADDDDGEGGSLNGWFECGQPGASDVVTPVADERTDHSLVIRGTSITLEVAECGPGIDRPSTDPTYLEVAGGALYLERPSEEEPPVHIPVNVGDPSTITLGGTYNNWLEVASLQRLIQAAQSVATDGQDSARAAHHLTGRRIVLWDPDQAVAGLTARFAPNVAYLAGEPIPIQIATAKLQFVLDSLNVTAQLLQHIDLTRGKRGSDRTLEIIGRTLFGHISNPRRALKRWCAGRIDDLTAAVVNVNEQNEVSIGKFGTTDPIEGGVLIRSCDRFLTGALGAVTELGRIETSLEYRWNLLPTGHTVSDRLVVLCDAVAYNLENNRDADLVAQLNDLTTPLRTRRAAV
jgi:hypothetical protein